MDMLRIMKRNWFLYDFLVRIMNASYNESISKFTKSISSIDSIKDFKQFALQMKKIPPLGMGSTYTYKRAYSENTLYGHSTAIKKYAGLCSEKDIFLPLFQHGIPYGEDFVSEKYSYPNGYIFQGRTIESRWLKEKKQKAYFIGPYIHYADSIYSEEEIKKIKRQNGNTALIFLSHSCEEQEMKIEIESTINKYYLLNDRKINTVYVCVYCMDAADIDIGLEKKFNIKFVSAGFKLDPLFISRLKTILLLSDVVFYSSFSSSIGYSFYLNKEIVAQISDETLNMALTSGGSSEYEKLACFYKLFKSNSKSTQEERYAFIDKYWGLSEIKDSKDLGMILIDNKKRLIRRIGF